MYSVIPLLGVLFVGLKLAGFIAWSWWWVTLPFWGGVAFAVVVFMLVASSTWLFSPNRKRPR